MTRPPKEREANRDQIVRARFTAAEKSKLLTASGEAGMTPSDFIRARTIGSQATTRKAAPERAALIRALAELGKIGSNVNQIARVLNAYAKGGPLVGVSKPIIEAALQGVATLTGKLLKEFDYGDGDTR